MILMFVLFDLIVRIRAQANFTRKVVFEMNGLLTIEGLKELELRSRGSVSQFRKVKSIITIYRTRQITLTISTEQQTTNNKQQSKTTQQS